MMRMTDRKKLQLWLLCILLLGPLFSTGQGSERWRVDSLFNKYRTVTAIVDTISPGYYVCECGDALPFTATLIRKISDRVSVIAYSGQPMPVKATARIAPANDQWKLSPAMERRMFSRAGKERRLVVSGPGLSALLSSLQRLGRNVEVLSIHRPSSSVIINCRASALPQLLSQPAVTFIDEVLPAVEEANIIGYDRSWHGINALDYLLPNANGKNIVAGVKEQRIIESDVDLWKRVLPSSLAAPSTSTHATIIASIIGGAGNSSYYGRGIAWGCRFYSSSFANLFADDAPLLVQNKVTVQNHSYGTVVQQFYGAEARSYDLLTWQNKTFVQVMSAGNQGGAAAAEGPYANLPGFANLTGNFKMAKNVISVAAIDDKTGEVAALSSAGPLYDGRLAPQITAFGPGGTSDAAAMVSGTVAVMQQVYADSNSGVIPIAALVKSILYTTTDDIHIPGPDYKTGYGSLNSFAAVRLLQQKQYSVGNISQGQQWTKDITVPANAAELRVTLAWTDSAATLSNNRALQNDLDLELVELASGTVYKPWMLNTAAHADSLKRPATRKRDSLNTAEQVSLRLPEAGQYRIRVNGTIVPNPGLDFAVAFRIDTFNVFRFTSPLHASDVNRVEQPTLNIRWQTVLADTTQTGNLFISYDGGTAWEQIGSAVKLSRQRYAWPVKDTNSRAILKMETGFGSFQSAAFMIAKITRLSLDFNCADSFRLSWNPHVSANGYRLFALTDSPYLKPLLVISDTAIVLQKSVYLYTSYAVEPLLSNGLPAARSDLLNINFQNVHCFYRSLVYTLPDKNKVSLTLELSNAAYVDSVVFERVSAGGGLLETYPGIKTGSALVYQQEADRIPGGVTYFRARIRLKNGQSVYTEPVAVLSSGEKKIWFYPSPARRGEPLNYILQQGVDADSKLLIYDISGRLLLQLPSISYQIDVSRFGTGVLVYKLLSQENVVIEAGKILVQ